MNKAFNKVIKSHIGLTVLTVLAVVLLTGGVTYSLFQIESRNSKNQTIAIGTLSTDMTSASGAIILDDMYPEDASDITDEDRKYTFTISNTGTLSIKYKIYLLDATDVFLTGNSEYTSYTKLSSDHYQYINYKLDGGSAKNLQSVKENSQFVVLEGTLAPGASEDHYIQFFIDKGDTTSTGAPNSMTGSILSLDIVMDANASGTIVDDIIASAKTDQPNFANAATTDEGVYAMEDNYGTSYYFRGAVENNYVKFANFYWRIIRVNGDGTLRLIYDGTQAHKNGVESTDRSALTNQAWNANYNDAKYVGYMFGGSDGAASTSKNQAQTNTTSSDIKEELDAWYKTNIEDKGYEQYLADVIFCNDRSTADTPNTWWTDDTANGYGIQATAYGAWNRFLDSSGNANAGPTPQFTCPNLSTDGLTVDATSTNKGNGVLNQPVGMITADEIVAAGSGKFGTTNQSYYLYKGHWYWSLSPRFLYTNGTAYMFVVNANGLLNNFSVDGATGAVAPVINLNTDYISRMIGTGTISDPYRVE